MLKTDRHVCCCGHHVSPVGTTINLVGGFNPPENISQIGSFPQVGVKIKNI